MKHITLLLMAAATICTNAFAQNRAKNIYTSTTTLNLEVLQNQAQPVVLNRTLFAGYNTICLPMSLSAEQLQAAAKDVQVERLEAIRQEGSTLCMYFLDCTQEGIQAGVPYLIFSPTFQTLHANTTDALGINTELKSITKTDDEGNTVTFGSSWEMLKVEGRYGIPAQQDTYILESILIRTDGDKPFLHLVLVCPLPKRAPIVISEFIVMPTDAEMASNAVHRDARAIHLGSDVVRKVRDALHRTALIKTTAKSGEICFQDILKQNRYIRTFIQRDGKDRFQRRVDFHGDNMPRSRGQRLRHRSDARTDFQNAVLFRYAGRLHDPVHNALVNQKVLPVLFLRADAELIQHAHCRVWFCQKLTHLKCSPISSSVDGSPFSAAGSFLSSSR